MYGKEQRQKDIEERINVILGRLKEIDKEVDDEDEPNKISKLERRKEGLYKRWDKYKEELQRLSGTEEEAATATHSHKEKGKGNNQPLSNNPLKSQRGLSQDAATALALVLIQFAKNWETESNQKPD